MKTTDIPYYNDYISPKLLSSLISESTEVKGIPGLREVGLGGGLETEGALRFVCELYELLKPKLNQILNQRIIDRKFIDQRTAACFELNQKLNIDLLDPNYETVIGHEDGDGRIVIGPKNEYYCRRGSGAPVAPIPESLQGNHITLFGPPDDAKLSINAMNAIHRKIKDEPAIVGEILSNSTQNPFWGADDEDSKTPLRRDLISAGENLRGCFDGDLQFTDPRNQKEYRLEKDRLSLPIKRFPGLALPCTFLIYQGSPLPLHLYDFALHLYQNWKHEKALSYYVPKLENEEEAAYIKLMVETAETLLKKEHQAYRLGSVRLFIVLENPRAIFRVNEIMDALFPYFAGASLGWHDYLASTARLFKNDGNYRIPVKADPDIVIKYIKASHDLLAEVVGSRGGIKIGGMYGILPMENNLWSPSFQLTMKGFIKDVVTQMKRNLSGFWVAHPDFIRMGLALVEAWKLKDQSPQPLEDLVTSLLLPEHHSEILKFIHGPDIQGLEMDNPRYPRSLIVADLKESTFIANHDPEEIRYNVFQSLQYLTDWLSGNGCVALPAQIQGTPVRVMDDLATAERSRWEVWHEIHHGRIRVEEFIKIAHEELEFIRKDLSNTKKIVQVKWDERTAHWYPIAHKLMIKLMTSAEPVEFATELLLPFTIESIRNSPDPLKTLLAIDPEKYSLDPYVERLDHYFSICGNISFAKPLAKQLSIDLKTAEDLILKFTLEELNEAASFHGNIGESKKSLDEVASKEQALVMKDGAEIQEKLLKLGKEYQNKFGFKYLISAQGKTGHELMTDLEARLTHDSPTEFTRAKKELYEISLKRLRPLLSSDLAARIETLRVQNGVVGAQIAIQTGSNAVQSLVSGDAVKGEVSLAADTWLELASLSKTIASAYALEYFQSRKISLHTSVNSLFEKTPSSFRIHSLNPAHPEWAEQVTITHLMKHNALNLHYVEGTASSNSMPSAGEILAGKASYWKPEVGALFEPGSGFQYSGGGFLVLEHLIESLEGQSIYELSKSFFESLKINELGFQQKSVHGPTYAHGYLKTGNEVNGTRLMFPAFAAGAMGTARGYLAFLHQLSEAFHAQSPDTAISHETAVRMLEDTDTASQSFMGVNIGIGVFIADAGANRFAIHQGANDGFRCLSLYCFKGPDTGKGFVILSNSDVNAVLFAAQAAQEIFKELKLHGVDLSAFSQQFDTSKVPSEEIVNLGYKELVFKAFFPDLPEAIIQKGPRDPLASINLATQSKITRVSNQRFARAENLISEYLPAFDPELYGRQGKVMDSWESARHNPRAYDSVELNLKTPSKIKYISLSTQYHLGNQAQFVEILGKKDPKDPWTPLVPKTGMEGHALKKILSKDPENLYTTIEVRMFPDGGLSRLGLYGDELPDTAKLQYTAAETAVCERFKEAIPQPKKPLTPKYKTDADKINANWSKLAPGTPVDLASQAYGGKILEASNEHYGPAFQVISPYPPLHMFDGLESARSREPGHTDFVVIELGKPAKIERIEIDFKYFVNNNPKDIQIDGLSDGKWLTLVPKTHVKPFAGNDYFVEPRHSGIFSQLKVTVFPDGGMNRIHVFGIA